MKRGDLPFPLNAYIVASSKTAQQQAAVVRHRAFSHNVFARVNFLNARSGVLKGPLFVVRKLPVIQQLIEERLDDRRGGSHSAPPIGARAKTLLSAVCALKCCKR